MCGLWAAVRRVCEASSCRTGHEVIGLTIIRDGLILTATENGYGKRTPVE